MYLVTCSDKIVIAIISVKNLVLQLWETLSFREWKKKDLLCHQIWCCFYLLFCSFSLEKENSKREILNYPHKPKLTGGWLSTTSSCVHGGSPDWDMDAKAKASPPSEAVAIMGWWRGPSGKPKSWSLPPTPLGCKPWCCSHWFPLTQFSSGRGKPVSKRWSHTCR